MTPGRIWEKIQLLQVFTFRELEEALLAEMEKGELYRPLLKGKIKYMIQRALREGMLVKVGKRYYLTEKFREQKELEAKIRDFPVEVWEEIYKILHQTLYRPS